MKLPYLTRALTVALLASAALAAKAGEPIQLPFQQALLDKEVSDIAIELGGYDVTHFARLEGSTVIIELASELEPGQYQASIVAFYADGEVQTLTDTVLTLAPSVGQTWQANASLNTSYRSDEAVTANFVPFDHLHSSGGINGGFARTTPSFDLVGEVQAAYDTNRQNSATGDELALAGYRAGARHKGDYGQLGLFAGDTAIAQETLIYSSYQRRGLSLQGALADAGLQGTLFSVVSDVTTSARDDLLRPDDSNNETVGGSVTFSPLGERPERLALGAGYVDGEGTSAGSGFTVAEPGTVYGGRSWNLTADSVLFERALWLHLEWAESRFDSDGIGFGEGALDDDAAKALVQLSSAGVLPTLGLDAWTLILQRQVVGADFYSIANLALPGDLESTRLTLNGSKGGFSFLAEAAQQENNEADDPTRATLGIDYVGLDLGFTPVFDSEQGLWNLVGAPSFNAGVRETETGQEPGDAALTGVDVDNRTREYALGATFTRHDLSWSVSYAYTDVDDRSEAVFQNGFQTYAPLPDNENRQVVLQLSWYPSPRFTLTPFFQWAAYEEPSLGNELVSYNTGFDSRVHLLPNRLILDLNYSFNRNDSSYGDPLLVDTEADNHTGNFQLTWKAVEAKNDLPGADLYLGGSYGRQDIGFAGDDVENWQVRFGLSVFWAAANP